MLREGSFGTEVSLFWGYFICNIFIHASPFKVYQDCRQQPVSIYSKDFMVDSKTNTSASSSSVAPYLTCGAIGGCTAWARHRHDPSIDSVINDPLGLTVSSHTSDLLCDIRKTWEASLEANWVSRWTAVWEVRWLVAKSNAPIPLLWCSPLASTPGRRLQRTRPAARSQFLVTGLKQTTPCSTSCP